VPTAVLLHCPIRGPLNVTALAKDGLTATEEARRIDFIKFLLARDYPETHISVETVIVKSLGESGRNSLRCDVIVYDLPVDRAELLSSKERLQKAVLVAEIKRESNRSVSAWENQLEPAMRLLPNMRVIGVYWDSVNRILFAKQIIKSELRIFQDTLSNLPQWGQVYKRKRLASADLTSNPNLVGLLFSIANIMRSHGINDEHIRYKETVKLILARYCDEREAAASASKTLALQVYPEADPDFMERVTECYQTAARRYSRAKTLFGRKGTAVTELSERTLRDIVRQIQGTDFRAASNETMQQVFMSFVPAVFKKSLDQYFTPIELVKTMVNMVRIGPNDKIADPGMGTADFLTAAVEDRMDKDSDILQRIYGFDSDQRAYDLAVVNMILNKDGQSYLYREDSIENHANFIGEMGVVLCNPPFGEKSIETRTKILEHYELGHEWEQTEAGHWIQTSRVLSRQQLGILFIEKCYKLLNEDGRMAIVLPEGYLGTASYGYLRKWILDNFRVVALVELPRRIFVKSNADLRSNVLVGQKLSRSKINKVVESDYPIFADMVRKVSRIPSFLTLNQEVSSGMCRW
jgi:type I restriction enzyme M protein